MVNGPGSHAEPFLALLRELGITFATGVPCSSLKDVFVRLEREPADRYVPAVREDAALGFAAGAWLGGRKAAVFMQNSGLGVCVNSLAQLHVHYGIPCLLVVSWRGYGGKDAPEHLVSAGVMFKILDALEIAHETLEPERMDAQVRALAARMESERRPVALVVPPGVFE